jgi:syntaxin 7
MIDDISWSRNAEAMTDAMQRLEKCTMTIRRSVGKIVTAKDIQREDPKVRSLVESVSKKEVPLMHDCLSFVERYMRLHSTSTAQGVKLASDARQVLNQFKITVEAFGKKCIAVEEKSRSRASQRLAQMEEGENDAAEDQELLENREASAMQQKKEDFEHALHQEILEHRKAEVTEIAENIHDINEIFQHINDLIGEQGEHLDLIEEQTSKAEEASRRAAEQLQKAQQQQRSNRMNQLFFLSAVIVVIIVIVAVMSYR